MLKKLMSNEFNRNVLKLMTGTTIAQAIPIAISPILTRLYTPEDFGVLALFVSMTIVLGSIANGRYELAIVLPKKEEDAINIVALSLLISSSFSLLLFIIIIFFKNFILLLLNSPELGYWIYFIPLVVFFTGLVNALSQLNLRMKTFGLLAKVKVLKSLTLILTQLVLGLLKTGPGGLISGQLVSNVFTNSMLLKSTIKNKELLKEINVTEMKKVGKKYRKFPLITMWGTLFNTLTFQITNILISLLYSKTTLGHYSLVQRTISLPTSIIGQAIGDVYFQKASSDLNEKGEASKIYNATFIKLLIIGLPMFIGLFIVAEDLIAFVFSEEWRIAGTYTKYMIPLFYIRFIASPLSLTNLVFQKQKLDFYWQIGLFLLTISVFILSSIMKFEPLMFFKIYTWTLFFHYVILMFITKKVSRGKL